MSWFCWTVRFPSLWERSRYELPFAVGSCVLICVFPISKCCVSDENIGEVYVSKYLLYVWVCCPRRHCMADCGPPSQARQPGYQSLDIGEKPWYSRASTLNANILPDGAPPLRRYLTSSKSNQFVLYTILRCTPSP